MKNKILVLILLGAIAIPQIVSASWWNPFSWSIFYKNPNKTEIIENKIKEPEKKFENTATTTATTTAVKVKKSEVLKQKITVQTNTDSSKDLANWTNTIDGVLSEFIKYSNEISQQTKNMNTDYDEIAIHLDNSNMSALRNYITYLNSKLDEQSKFIKNWTDYLTTIRTAPTLVTINEYKKNWTNNDLQKIQLAKESIELNLSTISSKYNNAIAIESGNISSGSQTQVIQTTTPASNNDFLNLCMGVDNDIRSEIQSGGGFATEAQVEALVHNRRQTLGCYNGTIPTAVCKDYTASYSTNRSGTCSDHGGVYIWY